MSNDLATLFTGRTYEIEVFPFSFAEYCEYYECHDIYKAFSNYVDEGGMSGSYLYNNKEQKYKYLSEIYDTLILRDIIQKHKVKKVQMLQSVSNYLMDNISNQMSIRNISEEITKNPYHIYIIQHFYKISMGFKPNFLSNSWATEIIFLSVVTRPSS